MDGLAKIQDGKPDLEILTPIIRKPFDVLAEGQFLKNGRGDWI